MLGMFVSLVPSQLPLATRTVSGVPHCRMQGAWSKLGQLLVLHPAEGTKLGWAGLWSLTASGHCGGLGTVGYSRVLCFALGLGDPYPAVTRDQSQVGAEGKLGVPSLCQLCGCHQGWRGVVQSHTLVPWGGSAAVPAHPVPWMGQLLALQPAACLPTAGWASSPC